MSEPTNAADGVSGGELDLDAIEARAAHLASLTGASGDWVGLASVEITALVAEVRRLRARFRLCDGCNATKAKCELAIEAGAIKCCPDCRHREPSPS